jgi:hypothetical protein
MFFGSMVFTPVRTESKPPGTDRVLNWAPYGLYQDQLYHLLSAAEVADKKKLDRNVAQRRYRATPKGKETRRQYYASDAGQEKMSQYEASEGRKESKMQASAAGIKRVREFLEARPNSKRHAVQQKTNEPSCGVLGDLLGGS